ncbi:MAG TPA: hypothetical protein VIS74_04930 [Chthoniobacterales bacterium]
MKKSAEPKRYFQDSWRPEDKAMESAEERQLEVDYPMQIARQRAERHKATPPLRGFEQAPRVSEPFEPSDEE